MTEIIKNNADEITDCKKTIKDLRDKIQKMSIELQNDTDKITEYRNKIQEMNIQSAENKISESFK